MKVINKDILGNIASNFSGLDDDIKAIRNSQLNQLNRNNVYVLQSPVDTSDLKLEHLDVYSVISWWDKYERKRLLSHQRLKMAAYIEQAILYDLEIEAKLQNKPGRNGIVYDGEQLITNKELLTLICVKLKPRNKQAMLELLDRNIFPSKECGSAETIKRGYFF
jgi:hypothetical protein